MKCAACGGADLEDGFLPDVGTAQTWVALWAPGMPSTKKSFWERVRSGGGVSLAESEVKVVEAKRCKGCGFLALFANRPPEDGESIVKLRNSLGPIRL